MSLDVLASITRRDFSVEVDLTIADGERFVLFGPSGAGKTTAVEAVAGLVRVDAGTISLGDRLLTDTGPPYRSLDLHTRRVGLVRQDPGLFPHLSVGENIGFARRLRADDPAVCRIAGELGIGGLGHALPGSLSGGQRQRVALARVLLSDYECLLLDEPYTGLDAPLARELTLRALELSEKVPSVMVTHHLDTAQLFADRIGVIDEGRLLQVGDPHEVVLRPVSARVAELVGYLSFLDTPAGVVAVHPDRVEAGAHPDRGHVIAGTVVSCRPAGVCFELVVDVGAPDGRYGGDVRRLPAPAEPGDDRRRASGSCAIFRLPVPAETGRQLVATAVGAPVFGARSGVVRDVPSIALEAAPR